MENKTEITNINGDEVTVVASALVSKLKEKEEKVVYFRPKFDDYFMTIAKIVATRSTCDRLRAGAVLVKDKRILATGYNGAPSGLPHCDGEEGHKMEQGHCIRTLHGEENTLLQLAQIGGAGTDGSTLYTTYSPCYHCAKKIITAGIKRVVCGEVYRDPSALKDLTKAGVLVEMYDGPDPKWREILAGLFQYTNK